MKGRPMLELDLEVLKRCKECRGCETDCPAYLTIEGYSPCYLIKAILEGRIEECLESDMIWQCLECHTCLEVCPQCYSWEKVMTALKQEAIKRGKAPKTVSKGRDTFLKTGRLGDPRIPPREKMKLPKPQEVGLEDFKKLVCAFHLDTEDKEKK